MFSKESNVALNENRKLSQSFFIRKSSFSNEKYFECKKTRDFINWIYVCDNSTDCLNGEDEENCFFSEKDYFECKNSGELILYQFVCNHIFDCIDKSDETDCRKKNK